MTHVTRASSEYSNFRIFEWVKGLTNICSFECQRGHIRSSFVRYIFCYFTLSRVYLPPPSWNRRADVFLGIASWNFRLQKAFVFCSKKCISPKCERMADSNADETGQLQSKWLRNKNKVCQGYIWPNIWIYSNIRMTKQTNEVYSNV